MGLMQHSHDHHHGHGHGHHHHVPAPGSDFSRAFQVGIFLNVSFVILEMIAGYAFQSLALLADAGHNLSDVLSLCLAWGAIYLSKHRATHRFTYGLRGSSILAALLNSIFLMIVVGAIVWEAIERLQSPTPINETVVMAVAGIGILINGFTAYLFSSGRKNDLNIRGAYLHMASDALVSLAVVVSALIMKWTNWYWIDPAMSLGVSFVIVLGTWNLLRESLNLALGAVPAGIDSQKVESYLATRPGVQAVHDLHIWGMSTTENALTAHLVMPAGHPGDGFLTEAAKHLHDHFKIHHTTLQIEIGNSEEPCALEEVHARPAPRS